MKAAHRLAAGRANAAAFIIPRNPRPPFRGITRGSASRWELVSDSVEDATPQVCEVGLLLLLLVRRVDQLGSPA